MHKIRENIRQLDNTIQKQQNLKSLIDNQDIDDDYLKRKLLKELEINISWLEDIKQDEKSSLMPVF